MIDGYEPKTLLAGLPLNGGVVTISYGARLRARTKATKLRIVRARKRRCECQECKA